MSQAEWARISPAIMLVGLIVVSFVLIIRDDRRRKK